MDLLSAVSALSIFLYLVILLCLGISRIFRKKEVLSKEESLQVLIDQLEFGMITPEQALKTLKNDLKHHAITEEEYQTQRAEIIRTL